MRISEHARTWDVLDEYNLTENDWLVGNFDRTGTIYINSIEGYIILFEKKGRILKSDI